MERRARLVLVGLLLSVLLASAAVAQHLLHGWSSQTVATAGSDKVHQVNPETIQWRVEQVEKGIQELRDQHVRLLYLLLSNLVAVIVSLVIYIVTRRRGK